MASRKDKRRGKRWSYRAGSYPYSVRVYERTRGGIVYAAAWDPTAKGSKGAEIKRSLGHRDREAAKTYAVEQAAKLRKGMDNVRSARPTVSRIFRLYRAYRTPDKSPKAQQEDGRQIDLWLNVLGADFDLSKLSRREWDAFVRMRRSGEINSHGDLVSNAKKRRPVGDRVVGKDLSFLRTVCHWATEFRDDGGRLLLEHNPTRGYDAPTEKNPERPVATHDRVDAIRKVYKQVTMRIQRGANRETVESWLPQIFEVAVGTGRRISAVLQLRFEDLDMERRESEPWGAITWPADTDKMGKEWRCPISARVREVLESAISKRRRLGHVGAGWMFSSPLDPRKPVSVYQASAWLRQAQELAELEPQKWGLWHPYRRLWASARKGLPDVDVMRAGGWSSHDALKRAYQRPDSATILRVVEHDAELREAK